MLSNTAIEKYKKVYFKKHGIILSDKEATVKANELINLFKVIYRPIRR